MAKQPPKKAKKPSPTPEKSPKATPPGMESSAPAADKAAPPPDRPRASPPAKSTDAYKDGDIIFREGEPSDRAFEIIAGQVEITQPGPGGEEELARLEPGAAFGDMGILDHGNRSATAPAGGGARRGPVLPGAQRDTR